MNKVYLSLGSNEGSRLQWLQKAIMLIGERCGNIKKLSPIYETAAWGMTEQPDFLNMTLEVATTENPEELLTIVHTIESDLGRQREVKWGQRTLDIDILLFNNEIIRLPDLVIPHPYLQDRLFVLKPLSEIAPDYIHPVFHKSIAALLDDCSDNLSIKLINNIDVKLG